MQYALLAYGQHSSEHIAPDIAALLHRQVVAGWLRLHADESATTLHHTNGQLLLTDGPFVDSKEYLAGVILIEADDLDGALAIAREFQNTRTSGAIEIRPVLESTIGAA
jgi:hypothetical protein